MQWLDELNPLSEPIRERTPPGRKPSRVTAFDPFWKYISTWEMGSSLLQFRIANRPRATQGKSLKRLRTNDSGILVRRVNHDQHPCSRDQRDVETSQIPPPRW